jgi:integrase
MTAATTSALVPVQPAFSDAERLALAGLLAGYRGLTREAYAPDLCQITTWCRARSLAPFAVRRADIEGFTRDLEARARPRTRARATVSRRLCTIAGLYRYAVEEELLEHSPAAHVRRPRVDYESHAVALDRNELGALLVAAGLGPPPEHALISLRALNGLRVSEAVGADVEHLGLERGHRTLMITRKGGKVVAVPLAPRNARDAEVLQDGRAQQDVADRGRLGIEDLLHQVAGNGAVVGDQLGDGLVRAGSGARESAARRRLAAQPSVRRVRRSSEFAVSVMPCRARSRPASAEVNARSPARISVRSPASR